MMKRYLRELFEAMLVAAVIASPFVFYFWSMKP